MKRIISGISALLTAATLIAPVSAFAINQDDVAAGNNTGTMTATYDVTAKYTVTIPAGVTLDSTNAVSKNIEASDVMLESGKKIKVTLTEASNTESGSSFSAKNAKGDSTATYTISKGETAVAVGDVVAEFTADGEQALTFSKAEGATYAGTHTETLTFGISVENAVTTRTVTFNTATDGNTINKGGVTCSGSFDRHVNLSDSGFSVSSGQFITKIEVTAADVSQIGVTIRDHQSIEGWSTTGDSNATWTGKSSTVPFGTIKGDDNPVTIVFTIEE